MTPEGLTASLKQRAAGLGFALAGACPAVTPAGLHRFEQWLASGYAGEMEYLEDRSDAYRHPSRVLDGARSLLLLAMEYRTAESVPACGAQGRVARYAWGQDYHDLIHERLHSLADELRRLQPGSAVRGVVDTAPLLEREFAQVAGLGWIGKNTLLLNKQLGSWFFLAALVTDVDLAYDSPHEADHCGTCRACLDACPTQAFVAPYVLDARRCISYLTIELRSSVPRELRPGLDNWLFGCDVCQDVCPWNHRVAPTSESALAPKAGMNPIELVPLFELDDASFRARFRHTPLWRPKRRGILRNAALILGNMRPANGLPALAQGLNDEEPLVRGACAWALGQYGDEAANDALKKRLSIEEDASVLEEIDAALKYSSGASKKL